MEKLMMLVSPFGDAMKRDVHDLCVALRGRYEISVMGAKADLVAFEALGARTQRWKPTDMLGVLRARKALQQFVHEVQPDIIHAHGLTSASVALGTLATKFAERTIASVHDPLRAKELPTKFIDERLGGFLQRAAALSCTYPTLARSLERRMHLPEGAFVEVPHAVAHNFAAGAARPPQRDGPIVGWIGPLRADLAWETAIDALAAVRKDLPGARLVLAGAGPARQFVMAHARERGVEARVTFPGLIPERELFETIDLLVVPSSRDAQPQALLEALCWGMPVVASNSGARADALGAVETGWLVDDDADGLADGIRAAWSDIDAAWSGAARQRGVARARYERDVVLERTLELYARAEAHARA